MSEYVLRKPVAIFCDWFFKGKSNPLFLPDGLESLLRRNRLRELMIFLSLSNIKRGTYTVLMGVEAAEVAADKGFRTP